MSRNNKIVVLVLGICGFYFLAYYFAISKTVDARIEIKELRSSYQNNQRISKNILKLERQNSYFDSIIQKNRINNTSLQNNILMYLNNYSKEEKNSSVNIVKFHKEHTAIIKNTKVFSFIIDLKGSYKAIEKLLYDMEVNNSFKLGSINHISLEIRKDYNKNSRELFARIILQHYQ
ncbi:MAG: hypothetical protein R3353_00095 [Salegentibacter mishustinae]|nr:hypothetical protein [Salegentibacter mishustinae]